MAGAYGFDSGASRADPQVLPGQNDLDVSHPRAAVGFEDASLRRRTVAGSGRFADRRSTLLRATPSWWPKVSWTIRPIGLFTASRIMVVAAVQAVIWLRLPLVVSNFNGPWPTVVGGRPLVRAFGTWDASWYLSIAAHGYFSSGQAAISQYQIAFFPVWPIILHYGSRFTHIPLIEFGVLMTFLIGATASCLVWRLCRRLTDQPIADRAIALWVFFPGSFVLSLVYAEGLTVALAAACLLCLMDRRWVIAGVFAGIATGVQPDALVLVLCCAWAAIAAIWRERQWSAIWAPVLSVTGIVAYFSYLWRRTGTPFTWYRVEKQLWHSGGGFYNDTLGTLRLVFHDTSPQVIQVVIGLAWAVICLCLMIKWRPPALIWIFTLGVLVAALASNPVGTRPRILLVTFPFVLAVAKYARGSAFNALLASSGFALGVLTIMTVGQPIVTP
jgi:hypothetical protein